MASKTQTPAVNPEVADGDEEIDLAALVAGINKSLASSSSSSAVQYLKDGETTLKLVRLPGQSFEDLFYPVTTFYKGKPGVAFITPAVIVACTDAESVNPNSVRFVQLPASVVRYIKTQVALDGWNLWTKKAALVRITKAKIKGKTEYSTAIVSKREFDDSQAARPDVTIAEAAEAENQRNIEKNEAEGNTTPQGEDLK